MKKGQGTVMAKMSPAWAAFFHRCWVALAVFLVVLAIIFTVFRALTPWVKQYKHQVEAQLSTWVGQRVTIDDLETSWYWFVPVLRMDQVRLVDSHNQVLAFHQVMVGINLLRSLWHWQVKPGVFYVNEAHFKIQQTDTTWVIQGLDPNIPGHTSPPEFALLGALLSQDKIIIKQVSADIALRDGTNIPLRALNMKISKRTGHYRIHGYAALAKDPETVVSLIGNVTLEPDQIAQVSGQVYLSIKRAKLLQWQTFFPQSAYHLTDGNADLALWFDLKQGRFTHIQSEMQLSHMAWLEPGRTKSRVMTSLAANLAWKQLENGWRLTADNIALQMGTLNWLDNALMIHYDQQSSNYRVYVKALNVRQLLQLDIAWPQAVQKMIALKPSGELQDTQWAWQEGQLRYFLTKFAYLGWKATKEVPALTQLFGVLYWQPTEGRLELDGEHTTLTPLHGLLPVTFDTFNVALDWKALSQGWRVSLDRLVLSHPNLVLSAAGAIDDPLGAGANVRLAVDFAAKSAQYWLPYIPGKDLKPKLDRWLKHDITRIGQVSGRMSLSGPWADFPFDNQSGIFSIDAHASGVDIRITPDWPMNRDIDADLHVKNRTFVADIDHANLSDLELHNVNLSVPDIGLGREALLLHGNIEALGHQIKSYVFATPLKHRLARWRGVNVHGMLGLDLQIEVPLYPESDHVLALGQLHFSDNQVGIKAVDNPAMFDGVTGTLQFNEFGLTDGRLEGTLADYPFTVDVQPLSGPKSGTKLGFEGEVTIDYLKHIVHHPVLSLMQGQLIVSGIWTLYPNESDMDSLHINSSLAGVAIHLPKPLGKSILDIAPITVDMAFHPKQVMDLHVDYDQHLKAQIEIKESAHHGLVETGDIHLGSGAIVKPSHTGLRVIGDVARANVDEWRKVFATWPKETVPGAVLDNLRDIDLTLGSIEFLGQRYQDLYFKAHLAAPKEWTAQVKQKNIAGDFNYHFTKNNLSGHFSFVNVTPVTGQKQASGWEMHTDTLPNLSVIVDELQYNGVNIGQVDLKTTSDAGHWVLNNCTVRTPEYQLSLEGDWSEKDQTNLSTLQAQMRLSHLAKGLERWHITPAVDARTGQVTFTGKWHAPFYDFSLRHLIGQMQITLKDGRISHLDSNTEKKLGLGKLLSILSLQTIPRRLKLDFSDLSEKGYSFDVFKGSFEIKKGVMSTTDSYIDGPVAFARLEGDLDLVNQLYDVDLRISPYIGASLPVVATIAGGGPVAGVATWAILKIINQGMQKISAYTYKISGPWLNPVVQQVSIVRSKG